MDDQERNDGNPSEQERPELEPENRGEAAALVHEERPQRGFGSAKGEIEMSEDFDEPLEDFWEYM